MGYSFYQISRPDGRPMDRGYGVSCKCHKRGCTKRIDRGLSYLCYECTWYFCGEHLTFSEKEVECFAGTSVQVCERCARELEKNNNE